MNQQTASNTIIYTDGACLGNPGPGGYAALILSAGAERVITGGDPATTNNRMEMTAVIKALESLDPGTAATLHSDSQIVIKGMNEWLTGWKDKGWKNAAKKPVANRDLWERLDSLNAERQITWKWVKGHNGHEHNECVDALANMEAGKASAEFGSREAAQAGFTRVGA
jgi:ribonuclease HI